MDNDQQNLKLLSIFHAIVGAFMLMFSFIPIIYIVIAWGMIFSPEKFVGKGNVMPPPAFGWILFVMGTVFFAAAVSLAICVILSSRRLKARKNYTFVFVIACIECFFMPFGTVLGILTLITLSKESVKASFVKS